MVSSQVLYAAVPLSVIVAIGLIRRLRSRGLAKMLSNCGLRGKTFIITGANSGIGYETAKILVSKNARVIFACRDIQKAKQAIAKIRKQQPDGGELIPMQLDLASLSSIESFVKIVNQGFDKIDVLINNAGVVYPLSQDVKTHEGFEIHLGVNHLGHFYLTNLLLDSLKRASPSRIVIVTSTLHERGQINFDDLNLREEIQKAKETNYDKRHNMGYCQSKLMNVYHMKSLTEKLQGTGVDVNACCPGFCYTNLFRHSMKWYYIFLAPVFLFVMRSARQGAEGVVFCATDYDIEGHSGQIYRDGNIYNSRHEFRKDVESKLWSVSDAMVKARKPINNTPI